MVAISTSLMPANRFLVGPTSWQSRRALLYTHKFAVKCVLPVCNSEGKEGTFQHRALN